MISGSVISELAVAERISAKAAQSNPKQRLHFPQVQCGSLLFLGHVPLSLLRRCCGSKYVLVKYKVCRTFFSLIFCIRGHLGRLFGRDVLLFAYFMCKLDSVERSHLDPNQSLLCSSPSSSWIRLQMK